MLEGANFVDRRRIAFLSSGQLSTVWRLGGALQGRVLRLVRPDAELQFGSVEPLARAVGSEYVHQSLAAVPLDAETVRGVCAGNEDALAAAYRASANAMTALAPADCGPVATIEIDHTQMALSLPSASRTAQRLPPLPAGLHPSEPCLCVEIKPKCGVLPMGPPLSESAPGYCRFCVQEPLKRKSGVPRSDYCPLDLYSTDRSRLERAVRCLLAAPRNNLRIFRREGQVVFGDSNDAGARAQLRRELRREFCSNTAGDADADPHSSDADTRESARSEDRRCCSTAGDADADPHSSDAETKESARSAHRRCEFCCSAEGGAAAATAGQTQPQSPPPPTVLHRVSAPAPSGIEAISPDGVQVVQDAPTPFGIEAIPPDGTEVVEDAPNPSGIEAISPEQQPEADLLESLLVELVVDVLLQEPVLERLRAVQSGSALSAEVRDGI